MTEGRSDWGGAAAHAKFLAGNKLSKNFLVLSKMKNLGAKNSI